jgi:hypothetical protein
MGYSAGRRAGPQFVSELSRRRVRQGMGTCASADRALAAIWGQDTKVHFMPLSRERTRSIAFASSINGAWMFAKAL